MLTNTETISIGSLPITLEQIKAHVKVDTDRDNELLSAYMHAACDYLSRYTGGYSVRVDTFKDYHTTWYSVFELGRFPLVAVASVKYYDANGVEQTVSPSSYSVMNSYGRSYLFLAGDFVAPQLSTDKAYPVTINYTAGQSTVNNLAKVGLLQLTAHLFEQRQGIVTGTISKPIEFALESICRLLTLPKVISSEE